MLKKRRMKTVQFCILFGLAMIFFMGGFHVNANSTKFKSSKVVLEVGSSVQNKLLNTKKNQKVTYSSKNKKIATVTKKGKITGKKVGKTKIVAVYKKKKYTCQVTVKKKKKSTNAPDTKKSTATPTCTPTISVEPTNIVALPSAPIVTSEPIDNGLKVTYIDVGQADSTLIQADGYNLLVDCGNDSDEDCETITSVLDSNNVKELDAVILTHWHEDHVGCFKYLAERYAIKNIYLRQAYIYDGEYVSKVAQPVLQCITDNKLQSIQPNAGEDVIYGNIKLSFVGPVYPEKYAYNPDSPGQYDENRNSMAFVLQYGESKFFFGGDTTQEGESDMVNTYADILSNIDCYKVNHHGSKYSNSYAFIRQMTGRIGTTLQEKPFYAIVSCGLNNMYYHPHQTVIGLLEQANAEIYRTDMMGNVVAVSDGHSIAIKTIGKNAVQLDGTMTPFPTATVTATPIITEKTIYIGNKNSNIVHKSTCVSLPIEKNRVYFDDLNEALASGYRKCYNCFE